MDEVSRGQFRKLLAAVEGSKESPYDLNNLNAMASVHGIDYVVAAEVFAGDPGKLARSVVIARITELIDA